MNLLSKAYIIVLGGGVADLSTAVQLARWKNQMSLPKTNHS